MEYASEEFLVDLWEGELHDEGGQYAGNILNLWLRTPLRNVEKSFINLRKST